MTTTTADKGASPAPTPAKPDGPPPAAAAPAVAAPPSDSVTLTIDGQKLTVKKGTLVVEAAKQLQQEIPVFCYHPKLKPVGACRMCLVEIEKMPRLQTACTTPVAEGMVVKTKSDAAKGGQNAVVAMLLANHPLDCPVCDKGGECPLQDNTFDHGVGVSKFQEEKRHKDKAFELSSKIVLDRERCILCYRCVRFHDEIPGDRALAVIDRGSRGEIGVLDGEAYTSPFQGNTIDICPVGALTSRQYRFRARPWDLKHTRGVAVDDPIGSNLWIDTRDGRVLRLRPRENAEVNGAWIADGTRFDTVPAERSERLGTALVRRFDPSGAPGGKLEPATWFEALRKAGSMMRNHNVGALASPALSNEALAVLAQGHLGAVNVWPRLSGWPVQGTLKNLSASKAVVVVGCDPFAELPMLALWIRKAIVPTTDAGQTKGGGGSLVVVGAENGLFRDTKVWLKGAGLEQLTDLVAALEGKGSADAKKAAAVLADPAQRPASIVAGPGVASTSEGRALLDRLATLLGCTPEASFFGAVDPYANARGARTVLAEAGQPSSADVDAGGPGGVVGKAIAGALDVLLVVGDVPGHQSTKSGFPVADTGKARAIWLTGALDAKAEGIPDAVDVVLPLASIYEQGGSFTNLEGLHQGFDAGGIPPGNGSEKAKADFEALALLATELGNATPKDLKGLRTIFASQHAFSKISQNRNVARAELNVV
ncbi:MAG: 2Fe-2S iron-sulfur cluster-binding protein [Deltaproteobacteria bacterium]|nr:2Fe-2S iron-sulfur cluster-binding protein [Deltaproteobacteria bacterium]